MALVQTFVLNRTVSHYGERVTGIIGLCAAIIGMLFFAFTDNAALVLLVCFFVGIQGIVMPSINAMMSRRTPENSQGELQGFNGSIAALAALAAPIIYNTSLSYFTAENNPIYFPGAPFVLAALLSICGFFIYVATLRKHKEVSLQKTS